MNTNDRAKEFLEGSFLKEYLFKKGVTYIAYDGESFFCVDNEGGREKASISVGTEEVTAFLQQIANLCEKQFSYKHPILDVSFSRYRLNATLSLNRSFALQIGYGDSEAGEEDEAASGRHTGLTVKATVTFQRWVGDIARFNGEAEFDACDALDSMDDEKIAKIERNDPLALDDVYLKAIVLGQIHDYDGPFKVELDEDNFSDYLEARRNGR